MKRYTIPILFSLVTLGLLPGCSLVITDSAVSTVEPGAAGQPVETVTEQPATEMAVPQTVTEPSTEGLRPIPVEDVQILTGWASPIPALVAVSGTWPDLCAQLAQLSQPAVDDFHVEISLLATVADPACPPDYLGLPFSMQIPLNWAEMPEGEYTVSVNGQETTLYIPVIPPDLKEGEEPELVNPLRPTPGAQAPVAEPVFPTPGLQAMPLTLSSLLLEVGVGSPSIVSAAITADWPSLCGQLASISQEVKAFHFDITVLAYPGRADCPPDYVGYGFGLKIPLNAVELAQGTYTVSVNGMETTFDVPLRPPAAASGALCPEVARPALALFLPGEGYLITAPLSGTSCHTTLDGDFPGIFQVAGDSVYYVIHEGVSGAGNSLVDDGFTIKQVRRDGTASVMPFSAPGLYMPQSWLDAARVVVAYSPEGGNTSTAVVGLDGSLQPVLVGSAAGFVNVLSAP